ncbi:MAG: transposase, partial [Nitrososphaera sp.]|nr:transposase [Nitrososphaera sp.]
MINDSIKVGLENDVSTMKALCKLSYSQLKRYDSISYYKLCAISHAAGILANRKKSLKRGYEPKRPYAKKPLLISCYGFKLADGKLRVPLGDKQYHDIPLNGYVKQILSKPSIRNRSFLLTPKSLSICYSKEDVRQIECDSVIGVDRNLANVTLGSCHDMKQYDLSKTVDIAENTRSIIKSFKRNDVRTRKKLYSKYGKRRKNRVNQLLHMVSKIIALEAKKNKTAIAFEDIRNIKRLYRRGNHQGNNFRSRMNAWPYHELKRQIEYKAAWEGIPVIQLSRSETRGTSQLCPRCGKKITQVDRKTRQLWCAGCERWMDRDVVAAMNLSIKGLARFASSKGLAGEAMKGNPTIPVILRVDASKLAFRR